MDYLEKAKGFNNFHKREFEEYVKYLFKKSDNNKLTKEYYQKVRDLYNQEEDEKYLDISNWNKATNEGQ